MGSIDFYEGNNCTQNIVDSFDDTAGQNRAPRQNDEARSVKLTNVRPGCKITVYDSPKQSTTDDWCEIRVKQLSNEIRVDSFEHSYENTNVQVSYHNNNGLDGKVSWIRID